MLVRVSVAVTAASEGALREVLRAAAPLVRTDWIEEVILQGYLFAGFPRALNAMRIWRTVSGREAPVEDADANVGPEGWQRRGEATCAKVYGPFYQPLRVNIATLHPALDSWMIAEGYGKVLGRPQLDLTRRELCVIGSCVAAQQDRQLHSHLHGALHAGATAEQVTAALEVAIAAAPSLDADAPRRYRQLWNKVSAKRS